MFIDANHISQWSPVGRNIALLTELVNFIERWVSRHLTPHGVKEILVFHRRRFLCTAVFLHQIDCLVG